MPGRRCAAPASRRTRVSPTAAAPGAHPSRRGGRVLRQPSAIVMFVPHVHCANPVPLLCLCPVCTVPTQCHCYVCARFVGTIMEDVICLFPTWSARPRILTKKVSCGVEWEFASRPPTKQAPSDVFCPESGLSGTNIIGIPSGHKVVYLRTEWSICLFLISHFWGKKRPKELAWSARR